MYGCQRGARPFAGTVKMEATLVLNKPAPTWLILKLEADEYSHTKTKISEMQARLRPTEERNPTV